MNLTESRNEMWNLQQILNIGITQFCVFIQTLAAACCITILHSQGSAAWLFAGWDLTEVICCHIIITPLKYELDIDRHKVPMFNLYYGLCRLPLYYLSQMHLMYITLYYSYIPTLYYELKIYLDVRHKQYWIIEDHF